MCWNVPGPRGQLGIIVFARQKIDRLGDDFRMLGLGKSHDTRTTWHPGAATSATGRTHDLPVKEVPDLLIKPANLPAARIVIDKLTIDELLPGILIGRAALPGPHIARHGAVFMPIHELLDKRGKRIINQDRRAVLSKIRRTIGYGRPRDPVARAVYRHREISPGCFGHLARRLGPSIPIRVTRRNLNTRLIKKRLVHISTRDRQLRMHAIDAIIIRPATIPIQCIAKARLPIIPVHIRRKVQVVLVQTTEIGDLRHIRPGIRRQLHWQALQDGLIGHHVHDDIHAWVLSFEPAQDILHHLTFVAIGRALKPDLLSRRGPRSDQRSQSGRRQNLCLHLLSSRWMSFDFVETLARQQASIEHISLV